MAKKGSAKHTGAKGLMKGQQGAVVAADKALADAARYAMEQHAREHSRDAIEILADVMRSPGSEPKDRIAAADKLLSRAHGKPTTPKVEQAGGTGGIQIVIQNYGGEQKQAEARTINLKPDGPGDFQRIEIDVEALAMGGSDEGSLSGVGRGGDAGVPDGHSGAAGDAEQPEDSPVFPGDGAP